MTQRTYGQYCGIARALELVGERWALLIVRDLLGRPKRYTELRSGMPAIPTNVLASRLKEMEANGVVQRRLLPRPESGTVYELTAYGRELEDVLLRLGRWGAKSLEKPDDGPGYVDPAIRALRSSFRPEVAGELRASFEIWFGEFVIYAIVDGQSVQVDQGALHESDLIIDARGAIIPLLSGDEKPEEALRSGRIRISGERELLDRFVEMFRMRPRGSE